MSDKDICNDALDVIGIPVVNSLDDAEAAAILCKRIYPRTLREMQEQYNWSHMRTDATVTAQVATYQRRLYKYAHLVPANFASLEGVHAVAEESDAVYYDHTFSPVSAADYGQLKAAVRRPAVDFEYSGTKIFTNFTPVKLEYYAFVADTTKFPEHFRTALYMTLAAKMCMPLTRDTKLTKQIKDEARQAVSVARDREDDARLTFDDVGSTIEDARW